MNKNEKIDVINALIGRLNVGFECVCRNENEFILFDENKVAIYLGSFDEIIGFVNGVSYLADKILGKLN